MIHWGILRERCPRLYKEGIAFECALGWYKLVHDLSVKIEDVLDKYAQEALAIEGEEDKLVEMFAVQVKEKYGTLRFYMSSETEEIGALIRAAELLSMSTCEICGDLDSLRRDGYLSVRCDSCFNKGK